jgi:hypothetical protein
VGFDCIGLGHFVHPYEAAYTLSTNFFGCLSYKSQLKNGWKSAEADPMGLWKGFWNLPGFTQKVKANLDCCGNALADVSGWKPTDISWTPNGGLAEGSHAKTRRREEREEAGFP